VSSLRGKRKKGTSVFNVPVENKKIAAAQTKTLDDERCNIGYCERGAPIRLKRLNEGDRMVHFRGKKRFNGKAVRVQEPFRRKVEGEGSKRKRAHVPAEMGILGEEKKTR